MFKKPKWLKPEVEEPVYYLHVLAIVLIVYFLVNTFVSPMEITAKNVLLGVLFITLADITAHTVLGLD